MQLSAFYFPIASTNSGAIMAVATLVINKNQVAV
jgi:hypothetical protein